MSNMNTYEATVRIPTSRNSGITRAITVRNTSENIIDAKILFEAQYGPVIAGPIEIYGVR